MELLFLSLGSNLGNCIRNINNTYSLVEVKIGKIISSSSIFETEPWGFINENYFLNQVLMLNTELNPHDILIKIEEIERQLGRIRNLKSYESRIIDIDILFYGNLIMSSKKLTIPHPLIAARKFVMVPLAELAPYWEHPLTKETMKQMLADCTDNSKVKKYIA